MKYKISLIYFLFLTLTPTIDMMKANVVMATPPRDSAFRMSTPELKEEEMYWFRRFRKNYVIALFIFPTRTQCSTYYDLPFWLMHIK